MNSAAERAEEVVGLWKERRDRGEALDPEDLLAQYPEIETEIRTRLAALALLDRAFAEATRCRSGFPEIPGLRIVREIGRGGMGVVYEAEQDDMHRRVAVKVLFPSLTAASRSVERFQREARAAGRFQHTNIVTVHDLGEHRGLWYCTMELVEGHSLDRVLDDLRRLGRRAGSDESAPSGPSPSSGWKSATGEARYFQRVAEMFAQVADALHQAHEHGIVHRDVKPSNLMLSTEGRLKLLDFGLAQVRAETSALTMTGGVVGTASYMSPEQARAGPVDARSDVWSLGATLYEALALRAPFPAKDVGELLTRLRQGAPPRRPRSDRQIPRDLDTIVSKALEHDPAARYASSGAMARDLRAFSDDRPVTARRVTPIARALRAVRRHKARTAVAACLVSLGLAATVFARQAAEADSLRRELEYDRLVEEAEMPALFPSNLLGTGQRRIEVALERAIEGSPRRWEAYWARALLPFRECRSRLADVSAAQDRGMSPRAAYFMRAALHLRQYPPLDLLARHEEEAAHALPPDIESLWPEAALEDVRGRDERHRVLLDRILETPGVTRRAARQALWARSRARMTAGDFPGALADALEFRAYDGACSDADARIAHIWRLLGRPETARVVVANAVRRHREAADEALWGRLYGAFEWNGEWSDAEESARAALEQFPDSWEFHGCLGLALSRRGQADAGVVECRAAVAIKPESAAAHSLLGGVLREANHVDEAVGECRTAVRLEPHLALTHTALGAVLNAQGDFDGAMAECREAIRLDPGDALAHENLGFALFKKDDSDAGAAEQREAIRLRPTTAEAHSCLAEILARKGDVQGAITEYREAVRLNPTYLPARANLGVALYSKGDFDGAIAEAHEAIRLDPTAAEPHSNLGAALSEKGDLDGAVAEFRDAIRLGPSHALPHHNLGNVLHARGDLDGAIAEYGEAIRLDPTLARAHFSLGNAVRDKGDLEGAIGQYRETIRLERKASGPDSFLGPALNSLGSVLHRKGDLDGAIAQFREAIRARAGLADPHTNLGSVLLEKWDIAGALTECREGARLAPRDAIAQFALGRALHVDGKFEDALEAYERAIALDSRLSAAQALRGGVLTSLGRTAQAAIAYDQALRTGLGTPTRLNSAAWLLTSAPDPRVRDLPGAIALAKAVVASAPGDGAAWNTLGIALCESGRWQESLDALAESMRLRKGGDANDWYFVAIATKHLGDDRKAHEWFDKAVAWTEEHAKGNEELGRFEQEARRALGRAESPSGPDPAK